MAWHVCVSEIEKRAHPGHRTGAQGDKPKRGSYSWARSGVAVKVCLVVLEALGCLRTS